MEEEEARIVRCDDIRDYTKFVNDVISPFPNEGRAKDNAQYAH